MLIYYYTPSCKFVFYKTFSVNSVMQKRENIILCVIINKTHALTISYSISIILWEANNNLNYWFFRFCVWNFPYNLSLENIIYLFLIHNLFTVLFTGAWGMDFVSPPPPFSLLPPLFQNFHINHSFFKIFIIIRFFFIWQYQ